MDDKYLSINYNSKSRWLSYWHQISETLEVSPENVLVIGKGSGITETSIKHLSGDQTGLFTLDINSAVLPDTVGDVSLLPFKKDSFDVVLCCQVLEHIPFDRFPLALSELHRIARKRVVLSFPHKLKHIKIEIELPFLKKKQLILKNPLTKKKCSSKQHFWEIGRGVSRAEVARQITMLFDIEKEFLNEISCNQRFFILRKSSS